MVKLHNAVKVSGRYQNNRFFICTKQLPCTFLQIIFCLNGIFPCFIYTGEHRPLCNQNVHFSNIFLHHSFEYIMFPCNAMFPEISGKQNFLSTGFNQKQIGIQRRMIHKEWRNSYIAKHHFVSRSITIHALYTRQSFPQPIRKIIKPFGKDFQNFLCNSTYVKRDILWNFLVQSYMVAVIMCK